AGVNGHRGCVQPRCLAARSRFGRILASALAMLLPAWWTGGADRLHSRIGITARSGIELVPKLRFVVLLLLVAVLASPADAARVSVIRDAEIEQLLRRIADPIFEAAGLHPDAVDLYLVQDDRLNAFVAGGQNL